MSARTSSGSSAATAGTGTASAPASGRSTPATPAPGHGAPTTAGRHAPASAVHHAVHAAHQAVTTAPSVSAGHLLLQLVMGLGVVVAVVLGLSRLVRNRAGGGAGRAGARRSPVRVVARHTLGKGVSVAVIEMGDQAYLVGVTPSSIRRLATADAAAVTRAEDGAARRTLGWSSGGAPSSRLGTIVSAALVRTHPALARRLGVSSGPSSPAAAALGITGDRPTGRGTGATQVLDVRGMLDAGGSPDRGEAPDAGGFLDRGEAPHAGRFRNRGDAPGPVGSADAADPVGRRRPMDETAGRRVPAAIARAAAGSTSAPGPRRRVSHRSTGAGAPVPTVRLGSSHGPARPAHRRGPRPAPTWTSAIEHLRERTVRRG